MTERTYRLSRDAKISPAELDDLLAKAWAECRNPSTASYEIAKNIVHSPEAQLPSDVEQVVVIKPGAQHLDPAMGALVVVTWIGGKVAAKVFDILWDKVIYPRMQALTNGALVEERSKDVDAPR